MAASWAAAALALASGQSPHAQARSLLAGCTAALSTVHFVAASPHSPALPQMVRTTRQASDHCDLIQPLEQLVEAHAKDAALESALQAGMNLTLGLGGYTQYLAEAAFGKQTAAQLHQAIAQIRAGRRETAAVLAALD